MTKLVKLILGLWLIVPIVYFGFFILFLLLGFAVKLAMFILVCLSIYAMIKTIDKEILGERFETRSRKFRLKKIL